MAITVVILMSGNPAKKISVPYKSTHKIGDLIIEVLKRGKHDSSLASSCALLRNGSELFNEDTLADLSIPDESELTLQITQEIKVEPVESESKDSSANAAVPPTNNNNEEKDSKKEVQMNEQELEKFVASISTGPGLPATIKQVDMVVLDLSGSMKSAAFHGDIVTRIEAAQAFFQTYIDKFHSYEVAAAVGLVCFGEKIDQTFAISRSFESFSTELGNLEANQSKTRLFEAILFAAQGLNNFRKTCKELSPNCIFRVFCLTDGQDNSGMDPYVTYQYLKQTNIMMDSIAIGQDNYSKLSRLTRATGGSCYTVHSIQAGVELFEREAVVSVAVRDGFAPFSMNVPNAQALDNIEGEVFAKNEVQMKVSNQIQTKAVSSKKIDTNSFSSSSGGVRRIMKEFKDLDNDSRYQVFLNESDIYFWKVILKGDDGSPYEGRYWMLTFQFPNDYPFKPPSVRFATPIFHCNINSDGKMCMDILKDQWSPALTAQKVLYSISSLLGCPNAQDPLDTVKAALYLHNREDYMQKAKEFSQTHAAKSVEELKATFNLS